MMRIGITRSVTSASKTPLNPKSCVSVATKRSSLTVVQPTYRLSTVRQTPFQWYSKKLDTHPILTKCVSAALIASVGNILAQDIGHRQEKKDGADVGEFQVDYSKVGRFALLNAVYVAPVLHYWYQFVNRVFPGKALSAVSTRVFFDEFVFTPMYLPVFMGGLWTMEGNEWNRVKHMLTNEMPSIIVAEWALWVPTMFATFRYAPVKYQVLVINIVGVVWQTFLSLVANNAHDGSCEAVEPVQMVRRKPLVTHEVAMPEVDAQNIYDFFEFHADNQ